MEGFYAAIIVLSLVALSVLAALVVKEMKTMNALFRTLGVDSMKTRLKAGLGAGLSAAPALSDPAVSSVLNPIPQRHLHSIDSRSSRHQLRVVRVEG